MSRKLVVVLSLVLVVALSFSAFAATDRKATWIDEVIIVQETSVNTAISRLQAGDIDIWASSSSDVTAFNAVVNDPNLISSKCSVRIPRLPSIQWVPSLTTAA